jgi:hypothetical protein
VLKKKIWANVQRIIEIFTKKIVKKLFKIWSWNPGSGKNPFRIPDPWVKKAPDPGSGSATLMVSNKVNNKKTAPKICVQFIVDYIPVPVLVFFCILCAFNVSKI